MTDIMRPLVKAMESEGSPYMGFLYAGLMIKDGKAKVLEFNARMGDPEAQPLLFRMKSDLVPILVAATEGKLAGASIEWDPEAAVCVVMSSDGYPGSYEKGKPISGIEKAEALGNVKVFHAGTGKKNDSVITNGGRVLGVTAKGLGIRIAIEKAYEAVKHIHWEKAFFRTDIGKKALDRS
jgi:phosphoribosylamine---glycine ligase